MNQQQIDRIEKFLMRGLWIIMWMLLRRVDRTDEQRILQWRHDYYRYGGPAIEGSD